MFMCVSLCVYVCVCAPSQEPYMLYDEYMHAAGF